MNQGKHPKSFYGYIVVLFATIIMVVIGGTYFSFGVFFKPLSADFGWTRAMTAGAFSVSIVLKGLFYILTGRLNDRVGPRIVMTGCGLLLGLGYLLMSRINTLWHLYLFLGLIIAIGMSGGWVPMVSTVSRWFVKRRGLMTGIVIAGSSLGTLIVPPIANWLITRYDWRTSYLAVGAAALVIIVLASQFLKRDPSLAGQLPYGHNKAVTGKEPPLKEFSLGEAVRTRQFWGLSSATLSLGFCAYAILIHIVPHATDLGISAVKAANILAIIGGAGILGRILMGSAGDRIGNDKAFLICFVIMLLTLALLLVTRQLWMLYLFAAAFGFAFSGMLALLGAVVADLFGLSSHGVILGTAAFGTDLGGTFSPVLVGHIFDTTESYQPAFLLCLGIGITGLILMLLLTRAAKKRE